MKLVISIENNGGMERVACLPLPELSADDLLHFRDNVGLLINEFMADQYGEIAADEEVGR